MDKNVSMILFEKKNTVKYRILKYRTCNLSTRVYIESVIDRKFFRYITVWIKTNLICLHGADEFR